MSSQTVPSHAENTLFNQNNQELTNGAVFAVEKNAFLQLDGGGGTGGPTPVSFVSEYNCTPAAILEFPSDGLTRHERRSGWIALHALIACYCFWLIAIVCDDYFVPVIDSLCESACPN